MMNFFQKRWPRKGLVFLMVIGGLAIFIQWMSAFGRPEFNIDRAFQRENVYPMVVLGSGPAGLSAALFGAREKLNPLIFKGGEAGGLLMRTTEVTNWLGQKSILGAELIEQLNEHVNAAGVQWRDDSVDSIDVSEWPYAIHTQNGKLLYALTIVIATGAQPRLLGIPGEQEYWGAVTTCAICDASLPANQGKDAVVVGGGDSALEEAMQSAAHQKTVTILVRKGALRAAVTMQDKLKEYTNIKIIYNVEVREVLGKKVDNRMRMTGVRVYDNKTEKTYEIPAQMMFLAVGHKPNTDFIKDAVACDEQGYIKIYHHSQETSVPGIYAAGEATDHRYRQAITSAGDGAKAGRDSYDFLKGIGCTPAIVQDLAESRGKTE